MKNECGPEGAAYVYQVNMILVHMCRKREYTGAGYLVPMFAKRERAPAGTQGNTAAARTCTKHHEASSTLEGRTGLAAL